MIVLLLDSYHLGDPLFLSKLARDLKERGSGVVIVHSSAEAGENAIESKGGVARALDGVWQTASDAEAASVERAGRELNRRIVHELNEVGVPAVRIMGADRGLVQADGADVRVGRTEWVATLVAQGVVPVVASFAARGDGPLVEVDPARTAGTLATALSAETLVVLGRDPTPAVTEVKAYDLTVGDGAPDVELVQRATAAFGEVVIASMSALRSAGSPVGTTIRA